MATSVVSSEAINFFVWFFKFIPLFVLLFPIHRGQWFQGGTNTEGLQQWLQAFSYLFFPSKCILRTPCREDEDLANYRDPSFPRCVRPETTNLNTKRIWSFADIYEAAGGVLDARRDISSFPRRASSPPFAGRRLLDLPPGGPGRLFQTAGRGVGGRGRCCQ